MSDKILHLLHFNDVYHIQPQKSEPIGGAARFATAVHEFVDSHSDPQKPDALVLFSGDVFNPSIESAVTRGRHMPPILRELRISAACIGNHDFDFGMSNLSNLLRASGESFPWLLSNVLDVNTNDPPDPLKRFTILEVPRAGLRIGLLGLVEREWIETIPSFPPELKHHDQIAVADELSQMLRAEPYTCHLVFALTHMRIYNDIALARACGPTGSGSIDLVLGGHDHFFYFSKRILDNPRTEGWDLKRQLKAVGGNDPEADYSEPSSGVWVIKSGTDFRELSQIELTISLSNSSSNQVVISSVSAVRQEITSSLSPLEALTPIIDRVSESVSKQASRPLGYTHTPLSSISSLVRTRECALGNLTGDLMLHAYSDISSNIDLAFLCGGTLRGDKEIQPGIITIGDIMDFFPFEDAIVVIRLSGAKLLEALENSVSTYPAQEGRFPHLSGIRITFDPKRPPGSRITEALFTPPPPPTATGSPAETPAAVPIDPAIIYTVVTREYMAQGYDGFSALVVPPEDYIIDSESGHTIAQIYRRFFLGLKYSNAIREQVNDECKSCKQKAVARWALTKWVRMTKAHKGKPNEQEGVPLFHSGHSHQNEHSHAIHPDTIRTALMMGVQGRPCCFSSINNKRMDSGGDIENLDEKEKDILVEHGYEHSGWGDIPEGDEDAEKRRVREWASVAPRVEGRITILEY